MDQPIRNIVIVGGGTAGWITAGVLAAKHPDRSENGIRITLIESPEISTLGVGEGTWPTIRKTLKQIGLKESDVLKACGASFKQGSRFEGWVTGNAGDTYVHPFELPVSDKINEILHLWQDLSPEKSFAETICVQASSNLREVAPRQRSMPDYLGHLNYAYHLDAVKLAGLLKTHAVKNLGVRHISDHVTNVIGAKAENISAVETRSNGTVEGDFFIDCTGGRSLLLGQHYGIEFLDQTHILFNDRAIVTRLPVDNESPIASETVATAHRAGWIWDIGLPSRRGIGCVYSSVFMNDKDAEETLLSYAGERTSESRLLKFTSGYRSAYWHQNCLAIGQSAGFLEPLEASAIVMIELAAEWISDNLPINQQVMKILCKKYNQTFRYRWERIVDFLKLHYVLSRRPEPYWRENRAENSVPTRLQDYLEQWKTSPPTSSDFEHAREVFPAASYQFVLYGMGGKPNPHPTLKLNVSKDLAKRVSAVPNKQRALSAALPTNRGLLASL